MVSVIFALYKWYCINLLWKPICIFVFDIFACVHMHTYMFILRMFSIGIHFLMVDADYSVSLFILNTMKSSHELGHSSDVKANSSIM